MLNQASHDVDRRTSSQLLAVSFDTAFLFLPGASHTWVYQGTLDTFYSHTSSFFHLMLDRCWTCP